MRASASKVHKAGGALYEGGRCVANNLPSLESGDRIRVKVERAFGYLRFWINESEVSTSVSGFQGELRPFVYLTGRGSSCTLIEKKERVIRCVVVAAEGLPKTDFITGLADPYVKLHLTSVQVQGGGAKDLPVVHSFRTETVRRSLTPEWNEAFVLTPHNLEDRLDLEVWDYDVVEDDDIMGSVACRIGDIIRHCDGVQRWYNIRNANHLAAGRLSIRFEISEPHEKHVQNLGAQQPALAGGPSGAPALPHASRAACAASLGPALLRKTTFQGQARMRRPRLKDLPECCVPDPALIRAIFQRCFNSKLTLPQVSLSLSLFLCFSLSSSNSSTLCSRLLSPSLCVMCVLMVAAEYVPMCVSVLQCVAVCCSVLQCVAVCVLMVAAEYVPRFYEMQRAEASAILPQIRYFFQLWENFENEVLGESSMQHCARFGAVRDLVWSAVNGVQARRPATHLGLPQGERQRDRAKEERRERKSMRTHAREREMEGGREGGRKRSRACSSAYIYEYVYVFRIAAKVKFRQCQQATQYTT